MSKGVVITAMCLIAIVALTVIGSIYTHSKDEQDSLNMRACVNAGGQWKGRDISVNRAYPNYVMECIK